MKINNPKSYQNARLDIVRLIEKDNVILDIGCNNGSTGKYYKEHVNHNSYQIGVDYNPEAISNAIKVLDSAKVLNLNDISSVKEFANNQDEIDTAIFADVLEHVLYPKQIVSIIAEKINAQGQIIISVPNTGYYNSLINILNRKWPRNLRGIYDKTHINIYMFNNLSELIPEGFNLVSIQRNLRWVESKVYLTKLDETIFRLLRIIPFLRDLLTFQYIMKLEKA